MFQDFPGFFPDDDPGFLMHVVEDALVFHGGEKDSSVRRDPDEHQPDLLRTLQPFFVSLSHV